MRCDRFERRRRLEGRRLMAWAEGHLWGTIYATLHGERRTLEDLRVGLAPFGAPVETDEVRDLLMIVGHFRRRERWGVLLSPRGSMVFFRPMRTSSFPRRLVP